MHIMSHDGGQRHVSLGCRLNTYESVAMRELADLQGLSEAIVVNTCAVTTEAVRKSRQAIKRLRRNHPDAQLVATGCAVQIDPDGFESMPEIDTILGNAKKLETDAWKQIAKNKNSQNLVSSIMQSTSRSHIISGFGSRSRAYIQVQNGCDHRCTFCVIPYGRGNSRSVSTSKVLEQVRVLVGEGYKEVVLSGVDITSWGEDLSNNPRLGSLVQQILDQIPDLQRLRVSSADPVELDDQFMEVLADNERLMPHLHLSVQAGDDLILKRMKRRHLRDDVISLCNKIRKLRPEVAFGADIIAGFPTETEAMFHNTLRLVEECELTWLHIFPYSLREGTSAARMPQVDGSTIRRRATALRQLGHRKVLEMLDQWVGKTTNVLVETPLIGRTEQFALVNLTEAQPEGQIIKSKLLSSDGFRLTGVPIST